MFVSPRREKFRSYLRSVPRHFLCFLVFYTFAILEIVSTTHFRTRCFFLFETLRSRHADYLLFLFQVSLCQYEFFEFPRDTRCRACLFRSIIKPPVRDSFIPRGSTYFVLFTLARNGILRRGFFLPPFLGVSRKPTTDLAHEVSYIKDGVELFAPLLALTSFSFFSSRTFFPISLHSRNIFLATAAVPCTSRSYFYPNAENLPTIVSQNIFIRSSVRSMERCRARH